MWHVILWGVLLAPALLLRFVLLRRGLRPGPALTLTCVIWFGNSLWTRILAQDHNVAPPDFTVLFTSMLSYGLLQMESMKQVRAARSSST